MIFFPPIGDEKSAEVLNSTAVSLVDALEFDPCPPVEAVKALGCGLSERYPPFNGLFQPICEQHQLCYACVSYCKSNGERKETNL